MPIATFYIVGNKLLKHDALPLRIMEKLRKEFPNLGFSELDPSEDLPDEEALYLIDTAQGIKEVLILTNIELIMAEPRYSAHDFGLGTHLKLLKKLGRLQEAAIICVPQEIRAQEALHQVSNAIRQLIPSLS
ncbi:hypothetical protein HY640_02230 [Candidatus Woesearchaeota archaeon]|nr:hypothetical protein [Candidatus Woesearchaeota archaeon]